VLGQKLFGPLSLFVRGQDGNVAGERGDCFASRSPAGQTTRTVHAASGVSAVVGLALLRMDTVY